MKQFAISLCFICVSTFSTAQIPTDLANLLQNVLDSAISTGGNHGVSAHLILQDGQTWTGLAGVDALNNQMTDSTVFISASISKLNIATLLLLLQEDSIIDLDDTWHKYLPALNVTFDTNITIRQLLNHTSGLADYLEVPANAHYVTSNFSTFYTPEYILENIVSGVPDFAAGTNFNYSNTNYCLAALVAEAATTNSLTAELRTRVWNPAGMTHTYFGAYEPIPMPRAGVWWNFGSGLTNYSNKSDTSMLSFGYGTDNVVTTPTDLALLVNAIINNNLLNAQSMSEMLSFVPQSGIHWTGEYGLGIHHLLGQTVDTVLGHNGKFCNQSDVFHSRMCGVTLATMTNSETLWQGIYNSMYNVIRNYYQCNTVPIANFQASNREACAGTTITFSDKSANWRPTFWKWDFPGGTLTGGTTLTDSMPQVIYNTTGNYSVTYIASSSGGSDSITKNGYMVISSNVAAHDSAFMESFETSALPNSDWNIYNTESLNWAITSTGAATGTKSVYIDNFSNTAGNISSLISAPFDLSGFSMPKLTFKIAYRQNATSNFEKIQVFTSTDCGSTWSLRWSRSGTALVTVTPPSPAPFYPSQAQFVTHPVNIASMAGSKNVLFKFNFLADPLSPGNYLFIDDISVFDAAIGINAPIFQTGVSFSPNPVNDRLFIDANSTDKLNISLFDINGKCVLKASMMDKSSINLSDLNEGIYIATIQTMDSVINKKLLIIR